VTRAPTKKSAPAKSSRAATKKPASAPPAKARSEHGGKREGAGRPRDKLPTDVIARIGAPPAADKPAALRTWNAKVLAEIQWLTINGDLPHELAQQLRANAGALERALPDEEREFEEDEDLDEERDGPDLSPIDDGDDDLVRVG
jgi:hypothetical protein